MDHINNIKNKALKAKAKIEEVDEKLNKSIEPIREKDPIDSFLSKTLYEQYGFSINYRDIAVLISFILIFFKSTLDNKNKLISFIRGLIFVIYSKKYGFAKGIVYGIILQNILEFSLTAFTDYAKDIKLSESIKEKILKKINLTEEDKSIINKLINYSSCFILLTFLTIFFVLFYKIESITTSILFIALINSICLLLNSSNSNTVKAYIIAIVFYIILLGFTVNWKFKELFDPRIDSESKEIHQKALKSIMKHTKKLFN